MMKKLIMTIGLVMGLACASNAGTNSLYKAKEFGVSLSSGYVVDPARAFEDDYTVNLSVGAHYFLTKRIGLEAVVPIYQNDGVSVDKVDFGLVGRLPLGPLAPYAGVSARHAWDAESEWAYVARLGGEYRFNGKWSTFVEGNYVNDKVDNWSNGETSVRAGIRLNF